MHNLIIIDDEPWAREVVKSLGEWETLGLNVIGEAEDGSEGLRLIGELKPSIVVTDMRMPGVDGVELLQAMTERYPSLKIIVMSGYDDFVYLKQAIQSRATDYLLKPVDQDELNAALRKCIQDLEERKQTVNTSWKSPLVFPDTSLTDRYIALRQRVFGALFELNKPAVMQITDKLEEFLANSFPEGMNSSMPAKIGDDFLRILEQFMSDNQVGFESLNVEAEVPGQWTNVKETLGTIVRKYAEAIDKIEAVRKTKTRLVIIEVQSYLEQHYSDPITLETVAHQFYVSKEHLSRAFKTTVGENLTEYIIRLRMERAGVLLRNPDVSIKQTAQMVGYPELAYFHRVFKKHFGITPGDFRSKKGS